MDADITTTVEAVMVISKDGEPVAIIRKNGEIKWFGLKAMSWGDFEQLLEANTQS